MELIGSDIKCYIYGLSISRKALGDNAMKCVELTVNFLEKGYFPDHLIPPFTVRNLRAAYREILAHIRAQYPVKKGKRLDVPRARMVRHSVPKRKLSRRLLCIPNPLHHVLVSRELSKHWKKLDDFCSQSSISLSRPIMGTARALESKYSKADQPRQRALRSVGKRYVLQADFTRFYPSIYTHAIPWAIHGKMEARSDATLYGNRIDERVRESQDKQTGGVPIGPDTSFLVGEIVGTAVDRALEEQLGPLSGTRFIDDFHLYFDSYQHAERALAALHGIAVSLELEVNDFKTEIVQLPEALEPKWKPELRSRTLTDAGTRLETQLLELFDAASDLARQFPHDNVLTYVARMVSTATIDSTNWPLCESLLLRSAIAEPATLKVMFDILRANAQNPINSSAIAVALDAICIHHAPLQQGNEVLWALWVARSQNITLGQPAVDAIGSLDDDLVALAALHLRSEGLLPTLDTSLWEPYIGAEHLYSEHWLLAYEALQKDWLRPTGGDYILNDPFFRILRAHDVSFYEVAATGQPPVSLYGDDDVLEDEDVDLTGVVETLNLPF